MDDAEGKWEIMNIAWELLGTLQYYESLTRSQIPNNLSSTNTQIKSEIYEIRKPEQTQQK